MAEGSTHPVSTPRVQRSKAFRLACDNARAEKFSAADVLSAVANNAAVANNDISKL